MGNPTLSLQRNNGIASHIFDIGSDIYQLRFNMMNKATHLGQINQAALSIKDEGILSGAVFGNFSIKRV